MSPLDYLCFFIRSREFSFSSRASLETADLAWWSHRSVHSRVFLLVNASHFPGPSVVGDCPCFVARLCTPGRWHPSRQLTHLDPTANSVPPTMTGAWVSVQLWSTPHVCASTQDAGPLLGPPRGGPPHSPAASVWQGHRQSPHCARGSAAWPSGRGCRRVRPPQPPLPSSPQRFQLPVLLHLSGIWSCISRGSIGCLSSWKWNPGAVSCSEAPSPPAGTGKARPFYFERSGSGSPSRCASPPPPGDLPHSQAGLSRLCWEVLGPPVEVAEAVSDFPRKHGHRGAERPVPAPRPRTPPARGDLPAGPRRPPPPAR